MNIVAIPLLADNYAWLLVDEAEKRCAVVDPSLADPVLAILRQRQLTLERILVTHHHWDHTGGVAALREACGGVPVVCSAYDAQRGRVSEATHGVEDGEKITVLGVEITCMLVPGHTLGAVAYVWERRGAVFTGDTLFTAGCGRLFEGTPALMHASLQRLAALPGDAQIFCGHEYTEKNLRFALQLEPDNDAVRARYDEVRRRRARGEATVPASLGEERRTNPFLRVDAPRFRELAPRGDAAAVFAALRAQRDRF